jgi:broad specificity phosphatase PhoE
MQTLRRIVLVRHGETVGNSSIRFHGSTDVELSVEGRQQAEAAARALRKQSFDLVVASPLRRSWQAAWIASRGQPVRIEPGFREIHFGRFEGLTKEEIQAQDPISYADWQSGAEGFEFPNGEARAEFLARVKEAVERLVASPARRADRPDPASRRPLVYRLDVERSAGSTRGRRRGLIPAPRPAVRPPPIREAER